MPWYVHILGGHALTGFFSWFLVIRQLYYRRERALALALFLVNILFFAAFGLIAIKLKWVWHHLLLLGYGANLAWSVSAWLFQRSLYGPAPKRYDLLKWRDWITPIITALAVTVGLSMILAIFPVIGERLSMRSSGDVLDKKDILWDLFQYIPLLLPYGLLVGIWWAGEDRRFSLAHVMTYLSGLLLFFVTLLVGYKLVLFFFFKGQMGESLDWPAIPNSVTGLPHVLQMLQKYDQSALAALPLLLGASSRIRDFWKRAFAIIPIVTICALWPSFYSADWWELIQGQIIHELSSPDEGVRNRAYNWTDTLLRRYPDHDRWPELALRLARYRYNNSDADAAKKLYEAIGTRYCNFPRWRPEVSLARAALGSDSFGLASGGPVVSLPPVSYQSYLTPNWMALLQVIRYWKGDAVPESEILIDLKSLSSSDEKIELSPLPGIAELDDSARNLGYELLIMPAGSSTIRALLHARIPVILPVYQSFYLIYGMDDTRSVFKCYSYKAISRRLRSDEKDDAKEILLQQQEGKGESAKQLARIADQSYTELPLSFWAGRLQKDSAPLMGVVYPAAETERIVHALNTSPDNLRKESNGYLTAFIGLAMLNAADPVQCIEWTQVSSSLTNDPLPLQIGHLAQRLWNTRSKSIENRLDMERRFPKLTGISTYFESDPVRKFLDKAGRRFNADESANRLPWMIRRQLRDFLDQSNPADLEQLIHLLRQDVDNNPSRREDWQYLAELYEWKDDIENTVSALTGALDSGSFDNETALQIAYKYVQLGRKEQVRKVMTEIDPEKVKYNAHYFFCKASLAEWEGETGNALKYFAKAIEMRRYIPLYHLRYGELLLKEGRTEEARQALTWASRIDGKGDVKEQASRLLGGYDRRIF